MAVADDSRTLPANAAIYYRPEGYTVSTTQGIMGRQSAGDGFLQGFFRYSGNTDYYCYTETEAHYRHFGMRLAGVRPGASAHWIPRARPSGLEVPGNLYVPGPDLGTNAWRRRYDGADSAYSLTGVTHTICSAMAMRAIAELLTVPVEPWDALICTSQAAKKAVAEILEGWQYWMAERFGAARPAVRPQLPVIPLGVDCAAYADTDERKQAGREFRRRHSIADDHVVILYFGRLSFHAKAHPLPMMVALEQAARTAKHPPVLLLAGWTANKAILQSFVNAAKQLCPSIRTLLIDAHDMQVAAETWAAADIFCSLSDNIQESFGLTPIEAQAAGLPAVVSDWDGYRDSVVDGETGFRIPSVMPGHGNGTELIWRYLSDMDNYDHYIGKASQCVAVDIAATAVALEKLITDPALRRKMGEAGRKRAVAFYDWKVVIGQYQALWAELAERRAAAGVVASVSGASMVPGLPDPFSIFASFPTRQLSADTLLAPAPGDSRQRLANYVALEMNRVGRDILVPDQICKRLLDAIIAAGRIPVSTLVADYPAEQHPAVLRTLAWLLKLGVLNMV